MSDTYEQSCEKADAATASLDKISEALDLYRREAWKDRQTIILTIWALWFFLPLLCVIGVAYSIH